MLKLIEEDTALYINVITESSVNLRSLPVEMAKEERVLQFIAE